jgi:hypothetical protein
MAVGIPPVFSPWIFGIELAFALATLLLCLLVYFKTREIYSLTKHEGIRYFRDAFLFFGLSYLLRFLFELSRFSMTFFDLDISREVVGPIFIFLLGYFSTMAILYLIFTSLWKRLSGKNFLIAGHVVAVILSVVTFLTRSHILLVILQALLLVTALILGLISKNVKKKISKTKILYVLIFALWLINLFVLERRRLPFDISLLFEIISLAVLVALYYRITKWIK